MNMKAKLDYINISWFYSYNVNVLSDNVENLMYIYKYMAVIVYTGE